MRILLLNMENGWRGGERQTLLSAQAFRDKGHDVAIVARQGGDLANAARVQDLCVLEAGSVMQLCRLLWNKRGAFDVFHAQTANTLTWLALLKPMLKGIVVFTRRTAFAVSRRSAMTAWKWRRADVLVAITRAAAAEPMRLGVRVDHIISSAVQHHAVRPDDIARLRAELVPHGLRVVATVAALTREKDPLTLIRAVHQLRQTYKDFIFLHFGSMGPLESEARQLVQQLGLEKVYIFTGFRPDIIECYGLMDVFTLSSSAEALGTSVLDAYLYNVPVAGTDAGGLAEILADGRGLASPVGDSAALAQNIARLLDDPALRRSLTEHASRYVHEEHAPDRMADRYLSAYDKGLSLAGRHPE